MCLFCFVSHHDLSYTFQTSTVYNPISYTIHRPIQSNIVYCPDIEDSPQTHHHPQSLKSKKKLCPLGKESPLSIYPSLSLSLSLFILVNPYLFICVCVIEFHVHVHLFRGREERSAQERRPHFLSLSLFIDLSIYLSLFIVVNVYLFVYLCLCD